MPEARPFPERLILTNDDGYGEPGLDALAAATEGLGRRWIIAPDGPRSSCGHAVTTGRTIRFEARSVDHFVVDGTPADCVRLGLAHLVPPPCGVLSGINAGGNLGVDIHHSGTVAAVREAALHGIPGVAFSHYLARGRSPDWPRATRWARRALQSILQQPHWWEFGTFWNVNFPHLEPGADEPAIRFCPVDPSPLPLGFRIEDGAALYEGNYHERARVPGSDVDLCFRGYIVVSRVRLA